MEIKREDLDAGLIDFSDIIDPAAPRLPPIFPGEILRAEWLEPLGITPYRLAEDISVPHNRITMILAGKRAVTADTALRLAAYFGTGAQVWLNLQARYDLEMARAVRGAEITRTVRPRAA